MKTFKKVLLLSTIILMCVSVHAQEEESDPKATISIGADGIKVKRGEDSDKAPKEKELKNQKTRWFLMDLGVNGYVVSEDDGSVNIDHLELDQINSRNFNLHIFRQRLNLVNHVLNLEYGLTLEYNNYRINDTMIISADGNIRTARRSFEILPNQSVDDLNIKSKSKLQVNYLTIPVLLSLETNPRKKSKSFKLAAGPTIGLKIKSKSVNKLEFFDYESKSVNKGDYGLNDVKIGARAQIGYGGFNLYGSYALTPLTGDDRSPSFNAWSAGLIISGF